MKKGKFSSFLTTAMFLCLVVGIIFLAIYFLEPREENVEASTEDAIVQLQEQVIELNENVNSMAILLEDKENSIIKVTAELSTTKQELTTSTGQLTQLTNTLEEKNQQIQSLVAENTTLNNKLTELEEDIETNVEEIEEVKAEIEAQQIEIESVQSEVNAIQSNIQTLNSQIQTNKTKIESLSERLEDLELDVETLHNEMENVVTQISNINSSIDALKLNAIKRIVIATEETGSNLVEFGNGFLIQWGKNNCSSDGEIEQELLQEYASTNYLIMLTVTVTPSSATVWGARVDSGNKTISGFGGYLTNRTSGGNGYSNEGGYYWLTIGMSA